MLVAMLFRACFYGGGGGYRTIIVRYVVTAQMCLCETTYQANNQGGYRTILGERNLPYNYRAIWGIATMVLHTKHLKEIGGWYASEVSRGPFGGESQGNRDIPT